MEWELELLVQHIVYVLHLNELPLRHLFYSVDGVTSSLDSFKGRIGKDVCEDEWKEPIVAFPKIQGKLPIISEDQLKDTSSDQYLLYVLSHAL